MSKRKEKSFIELRDKLRKYIHDEYEKNRPKTSEELLNERASIIKNEAIKKEMDLLGDGETAFGKGLNAMEITPELLLSFETKKFKIPYNLQVFNLYVIYQGNPDFYTADALHKRQELRKSIRINGIIRRFWEKYYLKY